MSLPGITGLLRPAAPGPAGEIGRQAGGREQRPHKITVYLSAQELAGLGRARPATRTYGVTVDRGRLVREAIAVPDLALEGEASLVARRLGGAAGRDPAGRP